MALDGFQRCVPALGLAGRGSGDLSDRHLAGPLIVPDHRALSDTVLYSFEGKNKCSTSF
jgi:hypothetical protein